MKKKLFVSFLFFLISGFVVCAVESEYKLARSYYIGDKGEKIFYGGVMFVNSPEGLRVRESGSLSAKSICALPNELGVSVIEVGRNATIDGITAPWVRIQNLEYLQRKTGWVFGGYLVSEKKSPQGISPINKNGADFEEVEKAANNGDALAQYKLGEYYKLGLGTKQDYKMAVKWYMKAAEQDEPMAFRLLAGFYILGLGVDRNTDKASEMLGEAHVHGSCWWQDIAERPALEDSTVYVSPNDYPSYGLSNAECMQLGQLIEKVYDGEVYIESLQFYMEAARHGNTSAMRKLQDAYERLRLGIPEQAKKWGNRSSL